MAVPIIARESNFGTGFTLAIIVGAIIIGFILVKNGTIGKSYIYDHFILKTIKINNLRLSVSIAKTPEEQSASLNQVKSMRPNEGTLFVFGATGTYNISTTDMLIPVDLMWIDEGGTIVDAHANVVPGLRDPIHPQARAQYVLMVNAGIMDQYDITVRSSADLSDVF